MPIKNMVPINTPSEFFEVAGAGLIQISNSCEVQTGQDIIGFHFGVEWGENGYAGGVLDSTEALRLADFIYEKLGMNNIIKKIED